MARITFLPTSEGVEVRDPGGDTGSLPVASVKSAGIVTAQHMRMLDEVFQWFRTHAGSSAPVVIERPAPDLGIYATRDDVRALVQALPRAIDMGPEIARLRGELVALRSDIDAPRQALIAATAPTSAQIEDRVARDVLQNIISQYETMDQRLRAVESVIETLRAMANIKAHEAAA
jgi:hypothetical protein